MKMTFAPGSLVIAFFATIVYGQTDADRCATLRRVSIPDV